MRFVVFTTTTLPAPDLSLQDDYRLPEGMKRIGYDADSSRYYFRDSDGSIWQGAEGSEFGELTRGTCDNLPKPTSS